VGENSAIAWCDHTFNPWWGCVEQTEGCKNCNARAWAHRMGFDVWGKDAPRRFFGEAHWDEPLKWNEKARKAGKRARVFCGSMCDVMEDRPDLEAPRRRLWQMIRRTIKLDWLLCTKLPQHYRMFLPVEWLETPQVNVWLLTTVENERNLWRARRLLQVPAVVRGISYEPALGPIDFSALLRPIPEMGAEDSLDWIIFGGESGWPEIARPCSVEWARQTIHDCRIARVPVFVKQLGSFPVDEDGNEIKLKDAKGANPDEWPEDLRVREFPEVIC
jgi:protein gp37